jgi:ParB family transcriptional regulator, chromosome partitioning protein
MGRKNLLQGLMDGAERDAGATTPAPAADSPPHSDPARARRTSAAIGAVSQSIAELKSRALLDIDPNLIDSGGIADRLDDDDVDHEALVASIREYGQQVPVMVRPHPDAEGRYQVVYGRRRINALRDIGEPVRALVRSLDDRALMLAQGQENNARKDLSFIEKANFARQMRELGYTRAIICAALHVDKTVMSRMMSVVERLDPDLIVVIGAAPGVGRDRWLALANLMDETGTDPTEAMSIVNLAAGGEPSDIRFAALLKALTRPADSGISEDKTPPIQPGAPGYRQPVLSDNGDDLGYVIRKRGTTVVTLNSESSDGFDDWLVQNLSRLHQDWQGGRGDQAKS